MRTALVIAVAAALAACGGRGDQPKPADSAAVAPSTAGLRPPSNPEPTQNTYAPALKIDLADFKKSPSGLYVRDDKIGTGAKAEPGQRVRVHYTGWLTDGTVFDASRDHGSPFTFTIGRKEAIDAWDEGVPGMRVGGVRTLVVPAALGYGAVGAEPRIPANAVLVFKLELIGVE